MVSTKKLVFYITKTKDSNGNVRFTIKATYPDSEFNPKSKQLWEQAWIIGKPKHKKEQEKLAGEFHSFIIETLQVYELHKVYNDRANFTMKFGDEYSTWCSANIFVLNDEPGQINCQLHCPVITIPLSDKEINFFWECIARPILIRPTEG